MDRSTSLLALASMVLGCSSASNAASSIPRGGTGGALEGGAGTAAQAGADGASGGSTANGGAANSASGGTASGGASDTTANSGGASGAGASGAAATTGGMTSGGSSAAGSSAAGSGGSIADSPFTCNLVFGVSPTGQWFDSGFLDLVDGSRWESIWIAHHYTNFWVNPEDSAWSLPFDPYPGPAHTCAQNSSKPDRILFVAVNWQYTTAAQWESDLTQIVHNLQTKYPSLRRIELMTLTRAPGNQLCSASGSTETIIPAWTDVAIAAIAAQFPALVVQAPKFEVPKCADFVNDGDAPQYTTAGAADVAQLFGSYYAAHP
jgi:hypothetical protein